MCGITALFEPHGPAWLATAAEAMTRLVRHRGPDGEGFIYFHPRPDRLVPVVSEQSPPGISGSKQAPEGCTLALGHRRLSIVDLSANGHQPMTNARGDVCITFNGEIYNYVELRAELQSYGHSFQSQTDTEVILAAWQQWGERCLERFNGMFALVLFDQRNRRVFAARDRFGVKPLYFWRTPAGGLALVSEIKQLTVHPEWRARLNGQRVYDFLNWGISDHTSQTMFAGVNQLRGGEFILAELDALPQASPQRWYNLTPRPFDGDFAAASTRFRELFDDSVRLRLRADVPVGSCLSGGLDSSSIVCTVHAQLGHLAAKIQKTFSAYSEFAAFDERVFIETVNAATAGQSRQVTPDPQELLQQVEALAWCQDEPYGSTSIFAQWCVFRLARQNDVLVMLDGQGADEALGGYHGYFAPRLAGLLYRGRWLTCLREAAAIRALHGQSWRSQAQHVVSQLLPASVADWLRHRAGRTVDNPDFINMSKLGAVPESPHRGSIKLRDPVRSFSRAQLDALNLPMLLRYEDRDSMHHSVEARLPFLDYRLVEFCLGLPEDYKISDGWTKRVLREGMRTRLPPKVQARRDKLGFATAEEEWMRGPLQKSFLRLIDEAVDSADGLLTDQARIKAKRMVCGEEPFGFFAWRVISFGAWLRRFSVQLADS